MFQMDYSRPIHYSFNPSRYGRFAAPPIPGIKLSPNDRRSVPGTDICSAANLELRGRDASYLAPPAQIRTCGFPAYGSHLGYRRQCTAVDEPTSCVTLIWL